MIITTVNYGNTIKVNKRDELTKIGESRRFRGGSGLQFGVQRKDDSEGAQTIKSHDYEANNLEFYPPRQRGNVLPGKEQLSKSET